MKKYGLLFCSVATMGLMTTTPVFAKEDVSISTVTDHTVILPDEGPKVRV